MWEEFCKTYAPKSERKVVEQELIIRYEYEDEYDEKEYSIKFQTNKEFVDWLIENHYTIKILDVNWWDKIEEE